MAGPLSNLDDLPEAFLCRCPVTSLLVDLPHLIQSVQVVLDAVDVERCVLHLLLGKGQL